MDYGPEEIIYGNQDGVGCRKRAPAMGLVRGGEGKDRE